MDLCLSVYRRISLTTEPIWFFFTGQLLIGPVKVLMYRDEIVVKFSGFAVVEVRVQCNTQLKNNPLIARPFSESTDCKRFQIAPIIGQGILLTLINVKSLTLQL